MPERKKKWWHPTWPEGRRSVCQCYRACGWDVEDGRWAGFWVKKTIHARSWLHEEQHPGRGHATWPAVLQPIGSPPTPRSPSPLQLRTHTKWRCAQPKIQPPLQLRMARWWIPGTKPSGALPEISATVLLSWFRGVTLPSFSFFFVLNGTRGEAKDGATILCPRGI